ncbi:aminodeoxychorismate/anthranilate synthase component II [Candidatus Micrarchaeota archaeon]|nr:aminodeoxychorismate/anthranilate synthase component II [Candidatus Micrarchaeota archaeon]
MKKIFIIDAYDSFVYMLYQYLGSFPDVKLMIRRSDKFTLDEIKKFNPDYIVLSPGPGHPKDSNFIPVIKEFKTTPILGVCLGHQAIGLAFGSKIEVAKNIMHGKTSEIVHDNKTIFRGLGNPIKATRYHSLIVTDPPDSLEVSAKSRNDNYIMAIRHKKYPIEGVQFHPESVLTSEGKKILKNFLEHYK